MRWPKRFRLVSSSVGVNASKISLAPGAVCFRSGWGPEGVVTTLEETPSDFYPGHGATRTCSHCRQARPGPWRAIHLQTASPCPLPLLRLLHPTYPLFPAPGKIFGHYTLLQSPVTGDRRGGQVSGCLGDLRAVQSRSQPLGGLDWASAASLRTLAPAAPGYGARDLRAQSIYGLYICVPNTPLPLTSWGF